MIVLSIGIILKNYGKSLGGHGQITGPGPASYRSGPIHILT